MVRTAGRVHQSPGAIRITSQPGLKDGWVWRSSGVDRKSSAVLAQNERFASKMRGQHISTGCKGRPRASFFACLRTAGKTAYGR